MMGGSGRGRDQRPGKERIAAAWLNSDAGRASDSEWGGYLLRYGTIRRENWPFGVLTKNQRHRDGSFSVPYTADSRMTLALASAHAHGRRQDSDRVA